MGLQPPMPTLDEARGNVATNFAYMADNAMLHDMAIADFHFVPHTDELSGTGAARLMRFAKLMNTYGGTIRYETSETDEGLIRRRLEHVREFITSLDCDTDRVELTAAMSGGRGLSAAEAIRIMAQGTVNTLGAEGAAGQAGGGSGPS